MHDHFKAQKVVVEEDSLTVINDIERSGGDHLAHPLLVD